MDIVDILLEAQADVTEILQGVALELAEPQMKAALSMQWTMLPEEAKELLKKTNRQLYDRVVSEIT